MARPLSVASGTRDAASRPVVAVVGGGWAGLAAAVEMSAAGWHVRLLEMAPQLGGRARTLQRNGWTLDNGQHILIGAYRDTLALMRRVGLDPDALLERVPLALPDARGRGLCLRPGPALPRVMQAVLRQAHWPLKDRLAFLARAAGWLAPGARCDPTLTVERWTEGVSEQVRQEVIEPLCVSALNTPSSGASASMFLRVLRDALLGGPGSADLLLPRRPLGDLLPLAAQSWLTSRGATIHLRTRVQQLERSGPGWRIDGTPVDAVVLACPPREAARLVDAHDLGWSRTAGALPHAAILTVYAHWEGAALLHHPMARLEDGPAQFVFDHGRLSGRPGLLACVVSAAPAERTDGMGCDVASEVLAQLQRALPRPSTGASPRQVASILEKQATLSCGPGLRRPSSHIAGGLVAAGDYVEGPYPSTLEGAVRSGVAAARSVLAQPEP
ncbi:MAG: hydroxysqualene dehydroxylase HpnE [Rubrivivax sp.]